MTTKEKKRADFDLLADAVLELIKKFYPDSSEYETTEGADDVTHYIKNLME